MTYDSTAVSLKARNYTLELCVNLSARARARAIWLPLNIGASGTRLHNSPGKPQQVPESESLRGICELIIDPVKKERRDRREGAPIYAFTIAFLSTLF